MTSTFRIKIAAEKAEDASEAVNFSIGNPSVEHITGVLHLYKRFDAEAVEVRAVSVQDSAWCNRKCLYSLVGFPRLSLSSYSAECALASSARRAAAEIGSTETWLQEPDTKTVCVLAVPADMGIAEFCQFLGSYMPLIASMRMVRREDTAKCTCMAAIDFKDAASARDFVADYNGRPFSSLEPEIICRAVFTTAVEIHNPADASGAASTVVAPAPDAVIGGAAVMRAPEGHVELPTCPVCLERLDEHVSGIFTTVRAVWSHTYAQSCTAVFGAT
jgi:BRCA1-associated protein 2